MQKQSDFLKKVFERGSLAHAYVFSGQDVDSITAFAKNFVQHIAIHDTAQKLIAAGNYPDLLVVRSANSDSSVKNGIDNLEIDIDQIRQVQNFLSHTSYYGGHKAVIIENAERMNAESQNCLLKSLEEPKGKTLIMLISSKAETLLPTISSRCQVLRFDGQNSGVALPQSLENVLAADLAEKFLYAKNTDLEGGRFEKILHALQNYWRRDVAKHERLLKLTLDLERHAHISNINKKLALETLFLET